MNEVRAIGVLVHKLLIIIACVPITPIVVGIVALYRKWTNRKSEVEIIPAQPFLAVD